MYKHPLNVIGRLSKVNVNGWPWNFEVDFLGSYDR